MEGATNWSESVEDLVHEGDIDKAISLLESVVSKLETLSSSHSDCVQLSSALFDLSKLYFSKGLSLKADQAQSRALVIKQRILHPRSPESDLKIAEGKSDKEFDDHNETSAHNGSSSDDGRHAKTLTLQNKTLTSQASSNDGFSNISTFPNNALPRGGSPESADDDWEAIADRAPEELLPSDSLPAVSKLTLEDIKIQTTKRRGRGTFSYRKHGLYSDQQFDGPVTDYSENDMGDHSSKGNSELRNLNYGTRHVLVISDFPTSTRTADLEKLLENFKDHGVVIRWVNDTVALAVFITPSIALEACNSVQCPFTLRILDEEDTLLSSIPPRDLEPPRQRPETSTRTARRLIAQGMGMKVPSTNFGSRELRKQEEARRNRIVSRQTMRDDAWGEDLN
ncbi:hypothetical protein NMG60_11015539 [Bertholletia excelsa]